MNHTAARLDHDKIKMAVATTSSVHKVTEKELPQYVDYVISKFDLRSFTVIQLGRRPKLRNLTLYVY